MAFDEAPDPALTKGIAALNKAAKDREPWLIELLQAVVSKGIGAEIASVHARLDVLDEQVRNPAPAHRRVTERQVDEQMELASQYQAAARTTDDPELRAAYGRLADMALRERVP